MVACVLAAALVVALGFARSGSRAPVAGPRVARAQAIVTDLAPNGAFRVQLRSAGAWRTVAAPRFGITYAPQSVRLGKATTRVRLVQKGGTAAQLDSVLLDGKPPVAVAGSSDTLVLRKLAAADNDVTDALHRTLVLTFASPGTRLEVRGRVQGLIAKLPFEHPSANAYAPVTGSSAFYTYRLSAAPTTIDTRATPFMREFVKPGTGHPTGYTYAWVANDGRNLLVTIDFTSDNTLDGNEDYATVHVKTPAGVKDFTLSASEKRWGSVAFAYTDKVAYQHKLYSFKIPLSEIAADGNTVRLGFATYGTASYPAGRLDPTMACDPQSNTYMLVYQRQVSATQSVVCGDVMNYRGYPKGAEFLISAPGQFRARSTAIAYDSVLHRYLVVWAAATTGPESLFGRLVNPDGTFSGPAFAISTRPTSKHDVSVTFDSQDKRFLVAWGDEDVEILGQLVTADGTLFGSTVSTNFAIASAPEQQCQPAVAYDSRNNRFLVVWADHRSAPSGIRGRLVGPGGGLAGNELDISSLAAEQSEPSVAYDALTRHYVVVCTRVSTQGDIAAQSLYENGSKNGLDSRITSTTADEWSPSIASGGGVLYAIWAKADGTISRVNYGRVSADGTPGLSWIWMETQSSRGFERPTAVYNPRGVFKWCGQINYPAKNVAVALDPSAGPDTFPPITSLRTANPPNAAGWYKSTGAITLTADEENGPTTRYTWISATGPWTVGSSPGGAAQGTPTLRYFSADSNGNTETVRTKTFKVDATRPRTSAPRKASVRRNSRVRLYYRVSDAYAAGTAYVKLVIKKKSTKKKTIDLGLVSIGSTRYRTYKATLPRGTYRFYVYATDQAGNTQSNVASNVLVIR